LSSFIKLNFGKSQNSVIASFYSIAKSLIASSDCNEIRSFLPLNPVVLELQWNDGPVRENLIIEKDISFPNSFSVNVEMMSATEVDAAQIFHKKIHFTVRIARGGTSG